MPEIGRGRFWRRLFAVVIDTIIVSAFVAAVGIALAKLTDGKIRVGNALINYTDCDNIDRIPSGIRLPPDFKITGAGRCTRSFFGIRYDWFLVLVERTQTGSITYTRTFTFPLDPAGHVTRSFYLDDLTVFLIIAYLLLQEWRHGATAGKRTLGLQVRSLNGAPLELAQPAKRLLRAAWLIPVVVYYLLGMMTDLPEQFGISTAIASLLLAIVFLVNFFRSTQRGALPWHDRWAGTEVIYLNSAASPDQPEQSHSRGPTP